MVIERVHRGTGCRWRRCRRIEVRFEQHGGVPGGVEIVVQETLQRRATLLVVAAAVAVCEAPD
jgi:hypothetical protein